MKTAATIVLSLGVTTAGMVYMGPRDLGLNLSGHIMKRIDSTITSVEPVPLEIVEVAPTTYPEVDIPRYFTTNQVVDILKGRGVSSLYLVLDDIHSTIKYKGRDYYLLEAIQNKYIGTKVVGTVILKNPSLEKAEIDPDFSYLDLSDEKYSIEVYINDDKIDKFDLSSLDEQGVLEEMIVHGKFPENGIPIILVAEMFLDVVKEDAGYNIKLRFTRLLKTLTKQKYLNQEAKEIVLGIS